MRPSGILREDRNRNRWIKWEGELEIDSCFLRWYFELVCEFVCVCVCIGGREYVFIEQRI